jgi:hypothetical protein
MVVVHATLWQQPGIKWKTIPLQGSNLTDTLRAAILGQVAHLHGRGVEARVVLVVPRSVAFIPTFIVMVLVRVTIVASLPTFFSVSDTPGCFSCEERALWEHGMRERDARVDRTVQLLTIGVVLMLIYAPFAYILG